MQVNKIIKIVEKYKAKLINGSVPRELNLWEAQQNFQSKWNFEATDFMNMYDTAIGSKETLRYWKNGQYQPKQMMMYFLKSDAKWVKSMFEDLFDQHKEVESRVDRFLFLMDESLRMYRSTTPLSIDTNHYHSDYKMISLYLSFRYPAEYAYYVHEDFVRFLQAVNSPKIPVVPDFVRFCKVSNIIYTFLKKEEGLISLFQSKLLPNKHYEGENRLIVFDLLRSMD